jgi:hypothetical protein
MKSYVPCSFSSPRLTRALISCPRDINYLSFHVFFLRCLSFVNAWEYLSHMIKCAFFISCPLPLNAWNYRYLASPGHLLPILASHGTKAKRSGKKQVNVRWVHTRDKLRFPAIYDGNGTTRTSSWTCPIDPFEGNERPGSMCI